jgi:hypothetical protein
MLEAKRNLWVWPVLNEASRNAVYNVCVVMEYSCDRCELDGVVMVKP